MHTGHAVLGVCLLLTTGCRFGERVEYDVGHGFADYKVMASDADGTHILTSDVDLKQFKIWDVNGNEVGKLPWESAGYSGERESITGPWNGAATAYKMAGFLVLGGDSVVHWIFPFFQGTWATVPLDTVPPVPESQGRERVCDITTGPDGSLYVLTGERTDLIDLWALGAAWIHRRTPAGVWSRHLVSVNVQYIASGCGRLAFDVVTRRLLMLDQRESWVRRFTPNLVEDGTFPVLLARSAGDMEAIAGYTYLATCESSTVCTLDNWVVRIYDSRGNVTARHGLHDVNAMTLERPPLPIRADREAWLWSVGTSGKLEKIKLLTDRD